MKIRPVGAALVLVDRQTIITKRNGRFLAIYAKAPKIVVTKKKN
jgi:hypothetical protein